jgi:hypothetical protein
MEATFDYLLSATDAQIGFPLDNDRLVQQWLWYRLATHDAEQLGHASRLAISDAGYALADPGLRWQQYARALPPEINLFGLAPAAPIITQGDGPLPVTVSLRIAAMNDGNTALTRTVMVTFYSNAALTQAIGSTTLSGLGGCARRTAVLSVPWANLNAGRHSFWARLDSTGVVAESNEGDNVVMGEVWVDPTYQLLLPAVRRG